MGADAPYERRSRPAYALGSVDNALQLIQLLRDTGRLRLTDAAAELGVSPSSAHRLLSMLVYRGFAVQQASKEYVPGPAMRSAPIEGTGVLALKRLVQPALERLSQSTGETANLMIRVGPTVRFLSTVIGSNVLSVDDMRGVIRSSARTSGGMALLAELRDEMTSFSRRREDGGTESVDADERSSIGVASNVEDGVYAVAVAIRTKPRGIAAISVSLPVGRLSAQSREILLDSLHTAKHSIEAVLVGHSVIVE